MTLRLFQSPPPNPIQAKDKASSAVHTAELSSPELIEHPLEEQPPTPALRPVKPPQASESTPVFLRFDAMLAEARSLLGPQPTPSSPLQVATTSNPTQPLPVPPTPPAQLLPVPSLTKAGQYMAKLPAPPSNVPVWAILITNWKALHQRLSLTHAQSIKDLSLKVSSSLLAA